MATEILDGSGRVVPSAAINVIRARALTGGNFGTPYDAADYRSQDLGDWNPILGSPDLEINPYRDRITARVRDLVRNDGWASGGVTRIIDSVIGGMFRLVAKPDWKRLSLFAPGFDAVWADEFAREAQSLWRGWADSKGRYCDAGRRFTFAQLCRLAFRHEIVDGEAIAKICWLPDRLGPGRADFATAVQMIDPDLLCNPMNRFDTRDMRGGVEIDENGAARAYHFRQAHMGDYFNAAKQFEWVRVPRETVEGRPVILHHFIADRADQHRGSGGVFVPVLARMKMLAKYDGVELQAAVVNAIFAAWIESAGDPASIQDALGETDSPFDHYLGKQLDLHEAAPVRVNGVRLPVMYPGEKINTLQGTRPAVAFEGFQHAVLRNCAAALGLSAEQLSQDWSKTNYSSARAALLEAWKTLSRRRVDFADGFASPIYSAWLEEALDRNDLPLPRRAPEFIDARDAYSRARWMGQPRGWIDPKKEIEAVELRLRSRVSTLEQECADQGLDVEEVIAQQAIERDMFLRAKLPLPGYLSPQANMAADRPELP